jgi:hypothetical protein
MESTALRHIRPKREIQHLFLPPNGQDILVKKGAELEDTMSLMVEKIPQSLNQTVKLAQQLKGKTLMQTCKNIWHFVAGYVKYVKDEPGKEQVKSPSRTLDDQKGDCDDYTGLISSLLSNLRIPHFLRCAKYWWSKDKFSHIYPVVKAEEGKLIYIDCVTDCFNHEEPTIETKDTNMDLYYLNGIERPTNVDYDDLSQQGFGNLGKLNILNKVGNVIKKGLNVINKVNPATALLRLGVLGSMKLNVMGVAEKLRFAYLSDEEAKKRGFNAAKFAKLKKIREKMEGIFYGAGGKPENLKEAILTGKGNSSKEVSGLWGTVDSLTTILGNRMYDEESLQGLGEPVTAAALTAASTVMATIAALIKAIGNMKDNAPAPTGTPETTIPTIDPGADISVPQVPVNDASASFDPGMFVQADDAASNMMTRSAVVTPESTDTPTDVSKSTTDVTKSTTTPPAEPTWWDKWGKKAAIGLGIATVVIGGVVVAKRMGNKNKKKGESLSGFKPQYKQYKKKNKKQKKNNHKIQKVRWT